MYIKRHAENTVRKLAAMFGAVLLTGARQVGKTTLLREITQDLGYVTLDDPVQLNAAKTESGTFFRDNPPPLVVDEVQYAPELFPHIKMRIDQTHGKGQFYLSGSQQFQMMKNVTESLAGRLGIVSLPGISMRERAGSNVTMPFLPTDEYFDVRRSDKPELPYDELWNIIQRGSMPELVTNADYDWRAFYAAYVRTYIERDVRELTQIGDEMKFLRFITAVASMTGQLLNVASLARDVNVSQPTAERWLSVLVASNLVFLLQPYHASVLKRAVKTPKLYFLDLGLAAYLTRWNSADVLKNGAVAGAYFESFVIGEIIKSYQNAGILDLPLYFYRDRDGVEIDLLIENNGTLHPLEIKKHADPSASDIKQFAVIGKLPNINCGSGGVICSYERLTTLRGDDRVIPVAWI
jgi:predicted AAA+ superfamily ATPase